MPKNICDTCGANLVYRDGRWVCPACGAVRQRDINGEEDTLLYNAAQKLRMAAFDEAEDMYRDVVARYPDNSAARWGLVLAKYGIKYEVDYDGKLVPTCYGANIASVQSDNDYRRAVALCDDKETRLFYMDQCELIERMRTEWLTRAAKEPKYDVFLCFKDSDKEHGIERTDDSYEVADLYVHLTKLGYKVFFSRECLRDKVAERYEPYIYNAVNTARAMVVYGGKTEYFTSTWMRNEWTRFLRRIRDKQCTADSLVVVCDGVNPAELPNPLDKMQVLDATQKTFYTDLVAHLAKICGKQAIKPASPEPTTTTANDGNAKGKVKATKGGKVVVVEQLDKPDRADEAGFDKRYAKRLEVIAETLEVADIADAAKSLRLLETIPTFVELCRKADKAIRQKLVRIATEQKHNYVAYFSKTDSCNRLVNLAELFVKQPRLTDFIPLFKQLQTATLPDLIVLKKFAALQDVYDRLKKQQQANEDLLDKWGK